MPQLRLRVERASARHPVNYGKRQERAELLVKRFRELAKTEPSGRFHGRTFAEVSDEIERQTEFGRELVYWSGPLLRALATRP